jgi:hypothetical protein
LSREEAFDKEQKGRQHYRRYMSECKEIGRELGVDIDIILNQVSDLQLKESE